MANHLWWKVYKGPHLFQAIQIWQQNVNNINMFHKEVQKFLNA